MVSNFPNIKSDHTNISYWEVRAEWLLVCNSVHLIRAPRFPDWWIVVVKKQQSPRSPLTQWLVIQPEFPLLTTQPKCPPPPTPPSTLSTSLRRTLSGSWRGPPRTRRATVTPSCTTPSWRCSWMQTPTRWVAALLPTWAALSPHFVSKGRAGQ